MGSKNLEGGTVRNTLKHWGTWGVGDTWKELVKREGRVKEKQAEKGGRNDRYLQRTADTQKQDRELHIKKIRTRRGLSHKEAKRKARGPRRGKGKREREEGVPKTRTVECPDEKIVRPEKKKTRGDGGQPAKKEACGKVVR